MKTHESIDDYIAGFPEEVQQHLQEIRAAIRKVVPEAKEAIKYAMPTFILNGNLVHFAGYKHHIGFYPAPSGVSAFAKQLSVYKGAKGSVQFPLDQPMPLQLITDIVKYRVKQNEAKALAKKSKTPADPFEKLSAPARRALGNHGIKTAKQLSAFSEKEILALHGIGKTALPILHEILANNSLEFKS